MGSTRLGVGVGVGLGFLLQLVACRFAVDEVRWLEAHGDAMMLDIAASSRGVDAVGTNGRVYHYPGAWGAPWLERAVTPSTQLAASPRATYYVDAEAFVWRLGAYGEPARWDASDKWKLTDLAVTETDDVYAISEGHAGRATRESFDALPCAQTAVALSAASAGVFLVSPDGKLWRAEDSGCRELSAPGPVTSVAAFGDKLAVVSSGVAYLRQSGGWTALPAPIVYRDARRSRTRIAAVSLSRNTLWARDDQGHVLMLSEPP